MYPFGQESSLILPFMSIIKVGFFFILYCCSDLEISTNESAVNIFHCNCRQSIMCNIIWSWTGLQSRHTVCYVINTYVNYIKYSTVWKSLGDVYAGVFLASTVISESTYCTWWLSVKSHCARCSINVRCAKVV